MIIQTNFVINYDNKDVRQILKESGQLNGWEIYSIDQSPVDKNIHICYLKKIEENVNDNPTT
jgi:hypothetical protein